jgi:hypothetical protein
MACGGLRNTEGVAFTAGETVDLLKLSKFGTEKVNYLKDSTVSKIEIVYKSHYDPRVLAFIGSYHGEHQGIQGNCMGILVPSDSTTNRPIIEYDSFNFAAAVNTELVWLSSRGIVTVSAEKISRIKSALNSAGQHGDIQYWTHADTVLWGYNCWFEYDTNAHHWMSARDPGGISCVKGGCSFDGPDNTVPSHELSDVTLAMPDKRSLSLLSTKCMVRQLGNKDLLIYLSQAVKHATTVAVFDCKGAMVKMQRIPIGCHSIYISGLSTGHYTARLMR